VRWWLYGGIKRGCNGNYITHGEYLWGYNGICFWNIWKIWIISHLKYNMYIWKINSPLFAIDPPYLDLFAIE